MSVKGDAETAKVRQLSIREKQNDSVCFVQKVQNEFASINDKLSSPYSVT